MKREWMQTMHDSLCIILNHLLFVAAAITVMDLFQADNSKLLLWSALVVVPFFFYYVTQRKPKLILPPMFIILLGGMSLAEKLMTVHDWSMYYYVITFVYLVGYFLFYFTKQFLQFLELNKYSASNIPEKEIFKNGIGQTLFFSACSSVILFMSANIDWVKAIMDRIWNLILDVLRYIFSGLETPMQQPQKEELTQKDPQLGSANMSEAIPEQMLEDIRNLIIMFMIVAIIIGSILFLYYIYYVVKGLEASQRRKKKNEMLKDDEDVREYCGIEKNTSRKEFGFSFLNNREKIRRRYRKKVLKRKAELIGEQEQQQLKYLTAKECCDRLSEQTLKMVYEKARYSEEMITAEEVRSVK